MAELIKIDHDMISLTLPDGFNELTAKDVREMGAEIGYDEWAIRNEELHLLYNIAWRKIPFLASFFKISLEKTAETTERQIQQRVSNFKKIRGSRRTIAGQPAVGFVYSYSVDGLNMVSEYLLFRHGNQNIAVMCIGREKHFEDYYGKFERMLDSISLSAPKNFEN